MECSVNPSMNCHMPSSWAEEAANKEASFVNDCAFAKVVSTARGEALLIQGKVIFIEGPDGWGYAQMLAKALRGSAPH
jgi:hypothetical protein